MNAFVGKVYELCRPRQIAENSTAAATTAGHAMESGPATKAVAPGDVGSSSAEAAAGNPTAT